MGLGVFFSLQRTQEIDDFLLLPSSHPFEIFDDPICFTAKALVIADGFHQVGRPSVVEEEKALADAPQGSGAELVWPCGALGDAVGEALAHVMDEQVGVKIGSLIRKGGARIGGGTAGNLYALWHELCWMVDGLPFHNPVR
jgi:hypothetical protein